MRLVIDFSEASKPQLLQIALHENCDMDLKYGALRELEERKKNRKKQHKNEAWYSFYPFIMDDLDKMQRRIKQLVNELTAFGVDRSEARRFITKKLMYRMPLKQKDYHKKRRDRRDKGVSRKKGLS